MPESKGRRGGNANRATSVRFVHTADLQLGMTRRFLDDDAQAQFANARTESLVEIGRLVDREGAEFVVVAGDVFETNRVRPRTVGRALEAMAAIPVPVYLLPGNHDPLDAATVYRSLTFERSKPPNVIVLQTAETLTVRAGVQLVGTPWPTKRPLRDLVGAACDALAPDEDSVRIVVGHGAMDYMGDFHDPAAIQLAAAERYIAEGRVQYIALGDRHSTTSVGDTGRIWYSGAPEPTAHDETDAGNVLVVDVDRNECAVTPQSVGTWAFVTKEFDLGIGSDLGEFPDWLDRLPTKDRTVVRLTLAGVLSLSEYQQVEESIHDAREVFGSIEEWEPTSHLLVRPDDDDFADLDLSGFARNAVDRLRTTSVSGGEDAGVARDALSLLVRLAHGRPSRL